MRPEHVQKGSLVYIPSGVRLTVRDEAGTTVQDYIDVEKPTNCVIMSNIIKNNLCKILYCGKLWYVKISDTYAIREQKGERAC